MADKVLAAIDLTEIEMSKKVLKTAVRQTRASEGTLTVLSVVPDIVAGIDFRYAIRGERGGSGALDMDKIVASTLERLDDVVEENTPGGMNVDTIVRHGAVYQEILEVAEELPADQIVIGAHHPGLADYMLGSNTERVLRHAKCSVSIVRN